MKYTSILVLAATGNAFEDPEGHNIDFGSNMWKRGPFLLIKSPDDPYLRSLNPFKPQENIFYRPLRNNSLSLNLHESPVMAIQLALGKFSPKISLRRRRRTHHQPPPIPQLPDTSVLIFFQNSQLMLMRMMS